MSFVINMKKVMSSGTEWHGEGQIDLKELFRRERDVHAQAHMPLRWKVEARDDVMLVTGEGTAPVMYTCARCLQRFSRDLAVSFLESFIQGEAPHGTDDPENGDETHYVSEDLIDLQPYAEEHVLLALPFIPLCDNECKGLCPQCGQNLNETPCDCRMEEIDPRLAGLAELKKLLE